MIKFAVFMLCIVLITLLAGFKALIAFLIGYILGYVFKK